jgi:DNA-binding IclR family transcriptional regulator
VVAAVSVSGPIERTSRDPGDRYAGAVREAAAAISATLQRQTSSGSVPSAWTPS